MGNQRKIIAAGREEADALWTQVNALITDLAGGVLRGDNVVRARSKAAAILADLTALRVTLAAAVVDLAALRTPIVAGAVDLAVLRAPIVAGAVDLAVLRTPIVANLVDMVALLNRLEHQVLDHPNVGDGGTAGRLRISSPVSFRIGGALYNKASTDDLWNLSGEPATDGTHYRAYWLYLDSAGTASFTAGTDALTDALTALAALPAVTSTKSVIGVYVAGPSTNFANALAAQGTIYNGWPTAQTLTAATPAALTIASPAALTIASPAALTVAAPSALTTDGNIGIANGTTDGRFKSRSDVDYSVAGVLYRKAATDDLWNLSALTTLTGAQYQAVYLYLDSSGTASVGAGTAAASADAAIAALPSIPSTKAVIGTFVAGLSTNYANALSSQGTLYEGLPAASVTLTATATTLISP